MITRHTPGPWSLKSDPFHFDTLSSIVGGATKGDGTRFPSHELHVEIGGFADFRIQEANARLIAASPDLLESLKCWPLKEILGMIEDSGDSVMRDRAKLFMEVRDAAISKATGEDAP